MEKNGLEYVVNKQTKKEIFIWDSRTDTNFL